MSDISLPQAFPVEAHTIAADTPCRKCGYNLRGLLSDAKCPECGTPAGVSLYGDLLRYSDPTWLANLAKGVKLILIGVLVAIVVGFGTGVLVAMMGPRNGAFFIRLVALPGSILGLIGGWLLTAPDPSGIGEDRYGTVRKIIRVVIVIGALHSVANVAIDQPTLAPNARLIHQMILGISEIVGVVGTVAQLYYLQMIAERIPDQKISQRAKFLKIAIPSCAIPVIILGLLAQWLAGGAVRGRLGSGVMAFSCFAVVVGLAWLVFLVMYMILIIKMGRRFSEQAALARPIWEMHQAG